MKRCRLTLQAETDLAEAAAFIACENPPAAVALLDVAEAKLAQLARFPESGRLREDLLPGIRSASIGTYVVFYRIEPEEVQVLRILHGSRDIATIVRGERE